MDTHSELFHHNCVDIGQFAVYKPLCSKDLHSAVVEHQTPRVASGDHRQANGNLAAWKVACALPGGLSPFRPPVLAVPAMMRW